MLAMRRLNHNSHLGGLRKKFFFVLTWDLQGLKPN